MKHTILLIVAILFLSGAQASSDVANQHEGEEWISLEFVDVGGTTTLSGLPRTWFKDGEILTERSSTNFSVDCAELLHAIDKVQNVSLSELNRLVGSFVKVGRSTPFKLGDVIEVSDSSLERIPNTCFNGSSTRFKYYRKTATDSKIQYESEDSKRKFILFRNPVSEFPLVHLGDARPFQNGQLAASSIKYDLYGLPYDKSSVLSLRSKIERTIFDEGFPRELIPKAIASLKKWNDALGFSAFNLDYQIKKIDPVECYTTRSLCLSWKGSAVLSWAGFGGYCNTSFDPASGEVIGGILTITNPVDRTLKKSPEEIEKKFLKDQLSINEIAQLYLSRNEMQRFEHPDQGSFVGSIFLHELGHFVGFVHNFAGSSEWKPGEGAKSVMDYLPFPAINHHSDQIGDWDRWALENRKTNRGLPPEYQFCSDSEGDQLTLSIYGKFENANCKKFDLGNPIEWAIDLAEKSPNGLLGNDDSLELFGGKPFPLLRQLGVFFFDGKSDRPGYFQALDYVCRRRTPDIEKKFSEIFGRPLHCDFQSKQGS